MLLLLRLLATEAASLGVRLVRTTEYRVYGYIALVCLGLWVLRLIYRHREVCKRNVPHMAL